MLLCNAIFPDDTDLVTRGESKVHVPTSKASAKTYLNTLSGSTSVRVLSNYSSFSAIFSF